MVSEEPFGEVDGRPVRAFRLDGGAGVTARLTDFGARLAELHVPGRDGATADIVLGFDDADAYAASPAYFGATVGRYGNRIRRGRFRLLGRTTRSTATRTATPSTAGGTAGTAASGTRRRARDGRSITFRTTSADGEMGFPGACAVSSTYELAGTRLRITMEAVPDATTIDQHGPPLVLQPGRPRVGRRARAGDAPRRRLLRAGRWGAAADRRDPRGRRHAVRLPGAARHRAAPRRAAAGRARTSSRAAVAGTTTGACATAGADGLIEAAEIHDPASGRTLRLRTTEPGVQMYTGGYLHDGIVGKGGNRYRQYAGFTLETQKFPDAPRFAHFPTTTVRAGETYRHVMVFDLSVD